MICLLLVPCLGECDEVTQFCNTDTNKCDCLAGYFFDDTTGQCEGTCKTYYPRVFICDYTNDYESYERKICKLVKIDKVVSFLKYNIFNFSGSWKDFITNKDPNIMQVLDYQRFAYAKYVIS